MFCKECGSEIPDNAVICVKCGVPTGNVLCGKSRLVYVLLGIFLGGLGIHNFYAGYTGRAVAQLLLTLLLGWLIIPVFIVGVWAIIDVCIITKDAKGNPFV